MSNTALQKDSKSMISITVVILAISTILLTFKLAAVNLGLSASTATLLYTALNAVAWGATAAAVVASFGLGAIGVQAIWAVVKKQTLEQFLKY